MLRDAKVLARCEPDGSLRVAGGRVEIRYKPGASKAYHAAARNLAPLEPAELLPDAACPDDPDAARGVTTGAGSADAGGAGSGGAGSGGASARATSARGAAGRRGAAAAAWTGEAGRQARKESAARAHDDAHALEAGAVVAYADGACSGNPGPAGLGVVLLDGDRREELSEYLGTGTNNIAELTAILRVAERLRGAPARPVHIYTDSSYAIGLLSKGWKAKANQALVAEVRAALRRLAAVTLHYVPGHAGVPLNERADALARQAVQTRRTTPWSGRPASGGARPAT
jgi:ribonuclease HI